MRSPHNFLLVYPREFLDLRSWVEGDDRIIFGAQSINMADAPWSADHVRGNSWNGIVMDRIEGKNATKIVFMGYANPQGWVRFFSFFFFFVLKQKKTKTGSTLCSVDVQSKDN
jgi:hypothetical protein